MTNNKTIIELRKDFLKQFDDYIINDIGDEEIIEQWLMGGLPDAWTEEDLDYIATDEEQWCYVCGLFGKLVQMAEGEG